MNIKTGFIKYFLNNKIYQNIQNNIYIFALNIYRKEYKF